MARQVELCVWCDLCLDHGDRVPASGRGVAISIDQAPPRTLDLCDRHRGELLQPLLAALADHGARPGRPRTVRDRQQVSATWRDEGPFRCLVAGCVAAPLKHRASLTQHLKLLHGLTLADYRDRYGDPVPLTAAEQAAPVEVRCEVEGCGQLYSTASGTRWPRQALVSHMRGRHGLKLEPDGSWHPVG